MNYANLQSSGECIHTVHSQPSYCLTIHYQPLWLWMIGELCQLAIKWGMHRVHSHPSYSYNITHCGFKWFNLCQHAMWWMHCSLQSACRASSSAHNGFKLKVDHLHSNPGWLTIGGLLWSTIWNQSLAHGFFTGPNSMFHSNKAQRGASDTIANRRKVD